ncbi:unnamed protein product [Brassicogethes aeneus]|uniref:Uncharacterized protein n=1 Tax=Brassicogethes aeneus TaxID=1431903 RepID=A0A9P0AT23_BRAAE|nr:unnamed protein product [Brassicogethes aeneus]
MQAKTMFINVFTKPASRGNPKRGGNRTKTNREIPKLMTVVPRPRSNGLCEGHLKARVYENKPRTLDELKDAIRVEVAQVERAMLENASSTASTISATTCLVIFHT